MEAGELTKKLAELHEMLTTVTGLQIDGVEALDDDSYQFRFVADWPERGIPLSCYAQINAAMDLFLIRGLFSPPFPPPLRPQVAEYILRINYPLALGNWAMEADTGEVRFKLGFCFGHETLTKHLMLTHLHAACDVMDQHTMGFVRLFGGASLRDALSTDRAPEKRD